MPYKPAHLKTKTFTKGKGKKKYVAKHKTGKGASKMSVRKVQGISGGLTETAMSAGSHKRLSKGVTALGAPAHYQITAGYDIASVSALPPAVGQQAPVILGQWNSVGDIENFQTQIPQIATIAGDTPTRFHMHSIKAVCTLNNPTGQTMYVDLYDIVAKRDIPNATATGLPYLVNLPTSAWAVSMTQQANSSLPYAAYQQLGAVPTQGQLFNDYYKVVSKRSVVLPQNATHVHTVSLKLDKSFDKGELIIQKQYLAGWKGFTYYTMAVVRGQPCLDEITGLTTTIEPAMRWVVSEHYTYSWLQANGSVNTFSNVMPYGSGTNVKVMQLNNPTVGPVIGV